MRAAKWASYRDCVLELLLPKTVAGQARFKKLSWLLSDDITSQSIELFFDGGTNTASWAEEVRDNLLPGPLYVFVRYRWVSSFDTISQCALLELAHGLLQRAGVP